MTENQVIQIENLQKRFTGNLTDSCLPEPLSVFEGFNLTFNKYQITSIVGPSGCGKSSLLNMISELDSDYAGNIHRNIHSMVGYIFQDDALIPWKTVTENILLGLKLRTNISGVGADCEELMREYGLYDFRNYYPKMLSGGMRQKVALAQMMINKPELVLLDEPFSSQDFFTKIQLENLFHKTIRGNKLSAILVTHDIDEAIALSDRIVVLSQKPCRILQDITLDFHVGEDRLLPEEVREMPSISSYFADIYQTLKPEL